MGDVSLLKQIPLRPLLDGASRFHQFRFNQINQVLAVLVLRFAVGNIRTTETEVRGAWDGLRDLARALR